MFWTRSRELQVFGTFDRFNYVVRVLIGCPLVACELFFSLCLIANEGAKKCFGLRVLFKLFGGFDATMKSHNLFLEY